MAFFDKAKDMTKRFGEAAQTAAKSAVQTAKEKSEQTIEIGKLKKEVLVENGKINKLYDDIGRNAYDIYCGDGDYAVLEPLFLQISDGLSKIEETKAKIEEVKTSSGIEDDDASEILEDVKEDVQEFVEDVQEDIKEIIEEIKD
jgi:gas vesicle protein